MNVFISNVFDEEFNYKSLKLYPIKLRDYFKFQLFSECLILEKNSVPDVKIIQMTYLQYLYHMKNENNLLIEKLYGLLQLAMKRDDFKLIWGYTENGKPFFKIDPDGEMFFSEDFDNIKEILAEQNMFELPDESIQKDVRDDIEKARRIKQRINQSNMADLEEQIVALSLYSGISLEKIYDMTIRKFMISVRRATHMIMSSYYIQASLSGMVEIKDKSLTRHWLVDLNENNKFSDITVALEDIQSKISATG